MARSRLPDASHRPSGQYAPRIVEQAKHRPAKPNTAKASPSKSKPEATQFTSSSTISNDEMKLPNMSLNRIAVFNQKAKAKSKSFRQALEDAEQPLEFELGRSLKTTAMQPLYSAAISTSSLASNTSSRKVAWLLGSEAISDAPSAMPADQASLLSAASYDTSTADLQWPEQSNEPVPIEPSLYSPSLYGDSTPTPTRSEVDLQEISPRTKVVDDADKKSKVELMINQLIGDTRHPVIPPSSPLFQETDTWFSYSMASPPLSTQSSPVHSPLPQYSGQFENAFYQDRPSSPRQVAEDTISVSSGSTEEVEDWSTDTIEIPEVEEENDDDWSDASSVTSSETIHAAQEEAIAPVESETTRFAKEQFSEGSAWEQEVSTSDDTFDIESLEIPSVPVKSLKSRVLAAIDTHAAQLSNGKYAQVARAPNRGNDATLAALKESKLEKIAVKEKKEEEPLLDFHIVWDRLQGSEKSPQEITFERPAFPAFQASGSSSSVSSQSSAMLFTEPPSPAASSASSLSSLGHVEEPKAKDTMISAQAAIDAQVKLAAARDALKRVRHNVVTPSEVETLAVRTQRNSLLNSRSRSTLDVSSARQVHLTRAISESTLSSPRAQYEEEPRHRPTSTNSRSSRSRHSDRDDIPIVPSRSNLRIGMSAPKDLTLLAKGIPSIPSHTRPKSKGKAVVYKPQTHITSINEVLS